MKICSLCTTLVVSALMAGCATPYSETPLATNFPTTKQQKLQAANHWNVIAGDVARQIASRLKDRQPLYVSQAAVKTPFDRVFMNSLVTALVAEGFTVQKSSIGALTVDVDTQAVKFSPDRPQPNFTGVPTALMTGVWALHEGGATAGAALYASVATVDALTWFRSEFSTGATPQTEIIITASVSDASQYLARSTTVYYVADTDDRLYQAPTPTATISLTGGQ